MSDLPDTTDAALIEAVAAGIRRKNQANRYHRHQAHAALEAIAEQGYELVHKDKRSVPSWAQLAGFYAKSMGLHGGHVMECSDDCEPLYRIQDNGSAIEEGCGVNGGPCTCGKHQSIQDNGSGEE